MIVVAFGGGVNSSALLIEANNRGYSIDRILFADTGGERPDTHVHIKRMSDWSKAHNQPGIERVAFVDKSGKEVTLENRCLEQKMLPSLAYGFKKCSLRFNRSPKDKRMNSDPRAKDIWQAGGKVEKWLGIDADESHRAKIFEDKKYTYRYPLVEWDLGREECREIIAAAGLEIPKKSSCFFCPASKLDEIRQLQRCHPDLLARALALEANAETRTVKGLGRRIAWKTIIDSDESQIWLFPSSIACNCYDG